MPTTAHATTSTDGSSADDRARVTVLARDLPDGTAFVYARRSRVLFVNSTATVDDVEAAIDAYVDWMTPAAVG